jgi:sialate O-acetylesterase
VQLHRFAQFSIGLALVVGLAATSAAAVKLPAIIGDNMVLQSDQPVPIWGWADKGEEVTVTIAGQTQTTKAGDDGRWKVVLKGILAAEPVGTPRADATTGAVTMQWRQRAAPLEMTVKGSSGNTITLKNILIGEVWVGSGQSNMEMGVNSCKNAAQDIADAKYPKIRLFTVAQKKATEPQTDCQGQWVECSPTTVPGFSAAAYFFGRMLHKELGVPVGLIHTSWGGTPAQFWTSRKTLESIDSLKPLAGGESGCLYNGMLAPIIPYAIRGAIWYQGEANVGGAYQYRTLFPAMIANWRADWGQGDFPFGFVQITPFAGYSQDWGLNPAAWAELCEAQTMTLKLSPNTGMAVTVDIADNDLIHPKNKDYRGIHPTNKQDVGRRLALWALAKVYGRNLVYSGPIYKSMAVEGEKIRLQFDHVGGGLIASDGKPLTYFTIAGADQKFVPATAAIDGNSIVVTSDQVAQPVAVRFAWRDDATPNLANKEGLPASPFRTDAWKGVTQP